MRQGATPALQGGQAVVLVVACLSLSFLAYEYSKMRNSGLEVSVSRGVEPVRLIFLQGTRKEWMRPIFVPVARIDGFFRKEKIVVVSGKRPGVPALRPAD